jgi:hypothetical protein
MLTGQEARRRKTDGGSVMLRDYAICLGLFLFMVIGGGFYG